MICSYSGVIKLFNSEGTQLSCRVYGSRNARKNIMKDWSKLYGKKIKTFYIQINPDIDLTKNTEF